MFRSTVELNSGLSLSSGPGSATPAKQVVNKLQLARIKIVLDLESILESIDHLRGRLARAGASILSHRVPNIKFDDIK